MFASLPSDVERTAAQEYMQARIERLHTFQQQAADTDQRWFEPPGGDASLPKPTVEIDSALLLTPPAGLEVGYVPVPIYQRVRTKPPNCDVVVGEVEDEPEPLSSNYFAEFPGEQRDRELLTCAARAGSATSTELAESYPGTIFPLPPLGSTATSEERLQYSYSVPLPAVFVEPSEPTIEPADGPELEPEPSEPTIEPADGPELEPEPEPEPRHVPMKTSVGQRLSYQYLFVAVSLCAPASLY
eukprot:COSAG02_NODE_2002_length_10139_cov_4.784761_3_plen_243_part_00